MKFLSGAVLCRMLMIPVRFAIFHKYGNYCSVGKNAEPQEILQAHLICKRPGSGLGNGANVKFDCFQTLGNLFINWPDGSLPVENYNRILRIHSAYSNNND